MTSFTPSFGMLLDVLHPNINRGQGQHRMHEKGEPRQEKTERRCQQAVRQAPGQLVWPGARQRPLEESPEETAAHTGWVPAWMAAGWNGEFDEDKTEHEDLGKAELFR